MWTSSGQTSGNGGLRFGREASLRPLEVGLGPRQVTAAERDDPGLGGEVDVARGEDRRQHPPHLGRDPPADPITGREPVRNGLLVPEPVVERRQIAGARLEVEALDAHVSPLHRRAEGVREIGVPLEGLAPEARAVAREPHDDRHHAARAVHAEHGHGVVDGPPEVDAVDRDSRSPARATADRRGLKPRAGAEDGAGEPIGQGRGVPVQPVGADRRPHAVGLEEHRRAVVVRGVQEDRLRRDAGQRRGAAARGLRDVPRHPQEIGGDEGDAAAAVVEHQRLRHERLVDPVGAARPEPPGSGLDAEGRGDVHAADACTKPTHRRASCV